MPLVKIKPGLSHGYRAADGSHAYHQAGDEFDASPTEMESFGDKFILVIEPEHEEPELPVTSFHHSATRGAIALATEHGISLPLSGIIGSGQGKRITKKDVVAFLDNQAAMDAFVNGDVQALLGDAELMQNSDDLKAPQNGDDIEALLNGDAK